jgi:hypothetical protein
MSRFGKPSNIPAIGLALVSSLVLFVATVPGWLGVTLFVTFVVPVYHVVTSG